MSEPTINVLVTGDVIIDHHVYMGGRTSHDSPQRIGSLHKKTLGGAGLLFDVIDAVSRQTVALNVEARASEQATLIRQLVESQGADAAVVQKKIAEIDAQIHSLSGKRSFGVQFGPNIDVDFDLSSDLHGYAIWKPFPAAPEKERGGDVWRIQKPLGYGSKPQTPRPFSKALHQADGPPPDILVLDDAGLGFRFGTAQSEWPAALQDNVAAAPRWVILKLSAPLGHGDLIERVQQRFGDRLILIIAVDDVRREPVTISRGISWERTALDLLDELREENPALKRLRQCRHLIVPFRSEGAVWVARQENKAACRLIFDPQFLEGEFEAQQQGTVFGLTSCLAAAVVQQLAKSIDNPDIARGIRSGLAGIRCRLRSGHGPVTTDDPNSGYEEVAREILNPTQTFVEVPLPDPSRLAAIALHWTIMAAAYSPETNKPVPLYGPATGVALQGNKALDHVPHLRCGLLSTVDRDEIESLRNLHALITEYLDHDDGKKPLSLAVFGPPGAGKSFSIKQIARSLPGRKIPILEFNLAQFAGPKDLIGSLHQVRDEVLTGTPPLVFFDEFDSQSYDWLKYLLGPMQDGVFQDGQMTHRIGKCIFVFAGGTSFDMDHFGPADPETLDLPKQGLERAHEEFNAFKLAKGPDFKSRLAGYLNVLGPNRRQIFDAKQQKWIDDEGDVCFPVRRALFLRSVLGLSDKERLDIDRGILAALLGVSRYKHGARSMERILLQMKQGSGGSLRRSSIPGDRILNLHVDAEQFRKLIDRHRSFEVNVDALAPAIHQDYQDHCRARDQPSEYSDNFAELSADLQGDNRAAAARIPLVLELVGLSVEKDVSVEGTTAEVQQVIERHIELLAEAEHDGWMEHKRRNGWVYAERRDREKRHHPSLRPYRELPDTDKEKDRSQVRNYPEILKRVQYRVVHGMEHRPPA